jgi:hypothetical protein
VLFQKNKETAALDCCCIDHQVERLNLFDN